MAEDQKSESAGSNAEQWMEHFKLLRNYLYADVNSVWLEMGRIVV
jgi:hypothetical protein